MTTYVITHLRIPGGVPNDKGLDYLEQVEDTARPYGGKWLAMGDVEVIEGAWPGTAILMEFPDRTAADTWYHSSEYQAILPLRLTSAVSDIVLIDSPASGFTVAGFAAQVRTALAAAS
ncbi:DUF1330 domain-containing protein [Actinoplanes sp. TBRC 11911]|uniref:DUF1330 domain-containing protein n=1 Tax=Actinoplanes sp. TBRC 11911 TaxID=2729386 RepID=UPI00145F7ED5|nr:DUF1330 domain-containing protein [Actinoplanes sp. TBRC 11911]NMO49934.1 DUF1330 domain-containing protein [Actinoplanes sp. TBRC 11911]